MLTNVIVTYEGEYFPGIVTIVKNTEVKMHMMSQCRVGWQQPDKDGDIFYRKDNIIHHIEVPTLVNKRASYQVKGCTMDIN